MVETKRASIDLNAKITVATPRGMRDFLPQEMNIRKEMITIIESAYRKYGFEPIETPALEYLSVLRAKCGEEAGGQIYEIEDMGMRFEFTAGLARLAANNSLSKPFKAYQIGPVWRRDEPQKGRYREFWQADADIIGGAGPKCEAELLACASEALKSVGIKKFKIRLNNIKTLDSMISKAGIAGEIVLVAKRALDKIKKKGEEEVKKEMLDKGIGKLQISELFKLINSKSKDFDGVDELQQIIDLVKGYGVENIEIDYSLARGLAYYTGPVFEFESTEDLGTITAGGRYDNLIGLYGTPAPAVGISLGIDRLAELVKKEKKDASSFTQIYIATINDKSYPYAVKVAEILRAKGINVSLNLTDRNIRKQMDYANSINVPFIAVIGEKEIKEEKITLRDMATGNEEFITAKDAAEKLERARKE